MTETNEETNREHLSRVKTRASNQRDKDAAHEMIAASPEILAATLEGLDQIRRGEAVRITRKKR